MRESQHPSFAHSLIRWLFVLLGHVFRQAVRVDFGDLPVVCVEDAAQLGNSSLVQNKLNRLVIVCLRGRSSGGSPTLFRYGSSIQLDGVALAVVLHVFESDLQVLSLGEAAAEVAVDLLELLAGY